MLDESKRNVPDLEGRVRIAVVTVCLNDLPGLRATFDSLRSQTQVPQEWIVVDGGSSDGTREWLQQNDWPPIRWTCEPDDGIYDGMNKGLNRVSADYVLFLNSGDELAAPDILKIVTDSIDPETDLPSLLFGDCFEVDSSGAEFLRRARPATWVPIGMPTTHQAMYFRADAIPDGFDSRYRLSGDYAAVTKLYTVKRGHDFHYLPKTLCRFKLGGRSDQQRSVLLRENLEIRKTNLGMGVVTAGTLHVLHFLHGLIKRHVPILHRLVRYG